MREITVHELDQVSGGLTGVEILFGIGLAGACVVEAKVYDNRAAITEWWMDLSSWEQAAYGQIPGLQGWVTYAMMWQYFNPQSC